MIDNLNGFPIKYFSNYFGLKCNVTVQIYFGLIHNQKIATVPRQQCHEHIDIFANLSLMDSYYAHELFFIAH